MADYSERTEISFLRNGKLSWGYPTQLKRLNIFLFEQYLPFIDEVLLASFRIAPVQIGYVWVSIVSVQRPVCVHCPHVHVHIWSKLDNCILKMNPFAFNLVVFLIFNTCEKIFYVLLRWNWIIFQCSKRRTTFNLQYQWLLINIVPCAKQLNHMLYLSQRVLEKERPVNRIVFSQLSKRR